MQKTKTKQKKPQGDCQDFVDGINICLLFILFICKNIQFMSFNEAGLASRLEGLGSVVSKAAILYALS